MPSSISERLVCIERVAVVCLLAVSMLVGSTTTARAECVSIPLRVSKQRADLMFSGVVTNMQVLTAGRVIVTFEVDQVWKGPIHRVTTIYQWMEPEAGPYEKGAKYLVIAPRYALLDFLDKRREARDGVGAASCGWGTPYERVKRELATLDRGHTPR